MRGISTLATREQQRFLSNLRKSVSEKHSHETWAQTYEEEVAVVNYRAPELLAETALKLRPFGEYLDIGCGTGLVGEAIVRHKRKDVRFDCCDLSEAMLNIARRKNIYRSLTCCNIFDMVYPDVTYDVVISAGVFASNEDHLKAGYANAKALSGAIRVLKVSGYCVFSVSARVWESDSSDYEAAIAQLPVRLIQKLEQPYHDAIPAMLNIVLQKTAA
jgi:predicted TPR repeat methyltransferase